VRRAANQNPVVQAALIGGLLLLFVIVLYTRVIGSGSGSAPAPEDTTATESTTPAPGAPAASAAPGAGTVAPESATTTPAAPTVPGGTATEFEAGKGLPEPVVNAYEDGKVVVLLIVRACGVGPVGGGSGPCTGRWREAGLDDKSVKVWLKVLRANEGLLQGNAEIKLFVTSAKDIARYSQIVNGVGIDRVPALIVIQPQKVSGDIPKASVSYGFRGPASVLQAVEDALYDGRNVPSYPE
jgi:hypothetical protein